MKFRDDQVTKIGKHTYINVKNHALKRSCSETDQLVAVTLTL